MLFWWLWASIIPSQLRSTRMNLVRNVIRAGRPVVDDYELVPRDEFGLSLSFSQATDLSSCTRRRWLTQLLTFRRALFILGLVPILLVCGVLWSGVPPTYSLYWQFERTLPQHNLSLPPPEGQNGSYVRFSNSLWGHGWNNVLQERVLLSHLAFLSNRSYVFEPYVWSRAPFPYTLYDFALRPSRIPLNAIVSGPGAGGGQIAPRAISSEWWETVCPSDRRLVLDSEKVSYDIGGAEGAMIMQKWVDTLTSVQDKCMEIAHDSHPVFDWE